MSTCSRSLLHSLLRYFDAITAGSGHPGLERQPGWDCMASGVVVEGALVVIPRPYPGRLTDLPLTPHPLACGLPRFGMVWPAAGAALSEEDWAVNPLPAGLLGGCSAAAPPAGKE